MVLYEKIEDVRVLSFPDVPKLDAFKAFRIRGECRALITEPAIKLVVDLSAVEYVDSSGVGVLLSIMHLVDELEGSLKLCGLAPRLYDLFSILQLETLFDIAPDREQAIVGLQTSYRGPF